MTSFWRMTTGAAALTAVLVAIGATASAEVDMELFTISPAEGFEVSTDPDSPAGLYTAKEFVALSGQSFDADMGDSMVFVQMWDAPDARGLSIVFEGASPADAAGFVAGAMGSAGRDAEEFDPGVEGAEGVIVRLDGVTEHVAVWRQGRYGVLVFGTSQDPARGEAVARELALRQSVQLVTVLGPDAKVTGLDSSDNSLAFEFGRIMGLLTVVGVIVGVVLFFVRRSSRRKSEQQWVTYPAGYVPPQFPAAPQFPPTVAAPPPGPSGPGRPLPPPPTL